MLDDSDPYNVMGYIAGLWRRRRGCRHAIGQEAKDPDLDEPRDTEGNDPERFQEEQRLPRVRWLADVAEGHEDDGSDDRLATDLEDDLPLASHSPVQGSASCSAAGKRATPMGAALAP
jgi:hypothetical protein